jgi:hypothetical protein
MVVNVTQSRSMQHTKTYYLHFTYIYYDFINCAISNSYPSHEMIAGLAYGKRQLQCTWLLDVPPRHWPLAPLAPLGTEKIVENLHSGYPLPGSRFEPITFRIWSRNANHTTTTSVTRYCWLFQITAKTCEHLWASTIRRPKHNPPYFNRNLILGRSKRFFSSPCRPNRLYGPPSLQSNGYLV